MGKRTQGRKKLPGLIADCQHRHGRKIHGYVKWSRKIHLGKQELLELRGCLFLPSSQMEFKYWNTSRSKQRLGSKIFTLDWYLQKEKKKGNGSALLKWLFNQVIFRLPDQIILQIQMCNIVLFKNKTKLRTSVLQLQYFFCAVKPKAWDQI